MTVMPTPKIAAWPKFSQPSDVQVRVVELFAQRVDGFQRLRERDEVAAVRAAGGELGDEAFHDTPYCDERANTPGRVTPGAQTSSRAAAGRSMNSPGLIAVV